MGVALTPFSSILPKHLPHPLLLVILVCTLIDEVVLRYSLSSYQGRSGKKKKKSKACYIVITIFKEAGAWGKGAAYNAAWTRFE